VGYHGALFEEMREEEEDAMTHRRSCVRLALALGAGLLAALAALPAAAQQFPNRPIRLVLPFPAGSAADTVLRPYLEHMSGTLGQNVLIDGRPGGGGTVAMTHLKTQPPDGYTLYYGSSTSIVRSLAPNAPADLRKDFAPIAPATVSPLILAVNTDLVKATTIRELVEEVRANPGKYNYASYGMGSGAHTSIAMLALEAKLNMVHVPYQGTAQATADTAAGRAHMTATIVSALRPFVASFGGSGKLRMLALTMAERVDIVPDVPGMREAGFPSVDFPQWGGVFGPAGLPRNIVDVLNRAINAAYKDPKMKEFPAKFGQVVVGGTPEDLARILEREFANYARLIREADLKLE
jgi:tripartite-type tricarboxylate transporter receptor subunit TctC